MTVDDYADQFRGCSMDQKEVDRALERGRAYYGDSFTAAHEATIRECLR
jgi:hypothetical protein